MREYEMLLPDERTHFTTSIWVPVATHKMTLTEINEFVEKGTLRKIEKPMKKKMQPPKRKISIVPTATIISKP